MEAKYQWETYRGMPAYTRRLYDTRGVCIHLKVIISPYRLNLFWFIKDLMATLASFITPATRRVARMGFMLLVLMVAFTMSACYTPRADGPLEYNLSEDCIIVPSSERCYASPSEAARYERYNKSWWTDTFIKLKRQKQQQVRDQKRISEAEKRYKRATSSQ